VSLCLLLVAARTDGRAAAALRDAAEARRGGDLPQMVARHTIRALVVYSKTHYFLDRGTPHGLSYDLLKSFEADLNRKLPAGRRVEIALVPVRREEVLPALREGRGDLAVPGLPISPERKRRFAFSRPTETDPAEIVVAGPNAPELASLADFAGRDLVCRRSSPATRSLEELNARLRADGRQPIRLREAPGSLADEDLIEMVGAGLIPAAVADRSKAELWKSVLPTLTVYAGLPVRRVAPVGWVFRSTSPRLRKAADAFLARQPSGSPERRRAFVEYLRSSRLAAPAVAPAALRRFEDTVGYFRTYSERYALDYLLMAAQGYHESRLDQSARSRTGAIGIMQVRPQTGRDMDVGDITQIGPNIHAGVKYVRLLVDRYRVDAIRPFDRAMFAFAAYNAGPARITRLRREARARGLDPNVWFDNVEWVAAEKIGRETAEYASSIYKYYVAYQLMRREREEPADDAPMSMNR